LFFAVLLMLTLIACGKKKETVATNEPVRERSAPYLLKRYERNEFDYKWLGMKVDASFLTMGETQSFKANIRMRKDSVVWVSISPALGIEVIRLMITPDSLKMMSKIPDNKYYYAGNFQVISDLVGVDLDFDMLQNLLIGNAVGLDKEEGRFRSEVNDNKHLLISRYKRKVRRVVGVDDRKLEDDTIVVNPNDPRYLRTIQRVDHAEDLIVSRYWLDPENYRLVQSIFNDLIKQRTVEIYYSEFLMEGDQPYPSQCTIKARNPIQSQELNFEITKLYYEKEYDFPFAVPEDYPRKDSL
jgi:hypothetical protein